MLSRAIASAALLTALVPASALAQDTATAAASAEQACVHGKLSAGTLRTVGMGFGGFQRMADGQYAALDARIAAATAACAAEHGWDALRADGARRYAEQLAVRDAGRFTLKRRGVDPDALLAAYAALPPEDRAVVAPAVAVPLDDPEPRRGERVRAALLAGAADRSGELWTHAIRYLDTEADLRRLVAEWDEAG
jgi:hypothetical protein